MENFEEVIRSPEFRFLIEPDRKKLTVHTGVVQNLSPPLAVLMNNGRMKESLSGTAAIEDIEEATFIAFREFGYHGRYKTLSRGDEGNSDDLSADGYAKSIETESIEARRWAQFKSIRFTEKAALPSSNPDFLTHAKVYVFGTRYLIDSLREKALKSLHRDLCEFQFGSQTVSRILDQLEYAFQNTGRQEPDRYYSLRMMVIECRMQGKVFD
ncbi:hypothetical protein PENSUB_13679 [Penicillium subrubescens]|uniref:BTB domain-containing protein n=1 Tax=Penicillium subrubescens TaxID=1316194 RepID=A0A1Q5SNW6_9EURO|nr:hypothetical protein PENSUB_13679 [Penicillium subrubescens]